MMEEKVLEKHSDVGVLDIDLDAYNHSVSFSTSAAFMHFDSRMYAAASRLASISKRSSNSA